MRSVGPINWRTLLLSTRRILRVAVAFLVSVVAMQPLAAEDITVTLLDLWLTGWLLARRPEPLPVFGPAGTTAMMKHLKEAFAFDIAIRIEDDRAPAMGAEVSSTDITPGVVYEAQGVRVIAFEVDHRPVVPAFGYRIEYGGHVVVLSGDTRYSENLVKHADHADLLIHEVADGSDASLAQNPNFVRVLAHHIRPAEAGKVFAAVKPKLAAYSHVVTREISDEELITRTRQTYAGPLVVGEDLMRFDVGREVTIGRP
jgi:ribonuclease Z